MFKTKKSHLAGVTGVRMFVHGHFEYPLFLKMVLAYAKKMESAGLRKSELHSRMEWEMILEGVQHEEFKEMVLNIAKDLESRLRIMGISYGEHLRAIANGTRPGKLMKPLGIFSMAYFACLFEIPRLYSGDNIQNTVKAFRKLNQLQNGISTDENGPREDPKVTGKHYLKKWISQTAYGGDPADITDPDAAKSVLIRSVEVRDGRVHYHLVLDEDLLLNEGQVTALSFSYGIQYEDATVHLCSHEAHFRLPTALRRCYEYMKGVPSTKVIWTDIFNDTYFELRLKKGGMEWGELLCSIYQKNVTFKGGWHGREGSYFNRGWILQEFMCGLPFETGSIYDKSMGALSQYEEAAQQMGPYDRLIWVTCWSALLWYTDGLTNRGDARNAFAGLLSEEVREYGLAVLERIGNMWLEGPGPGSDFRSIRDAMGWVSRAMGPDEFKRASLTVERMLCEATMVLMASTHRLPTYDADAGTDRESVGMLETGIVIAVASGLVRGGYPDFVTLPEDDCDNGESDISSENEVLLSPSSSL